MRKTVFVAGYVFAAIAPVSVHAQVSDNVIRIGVLTDLSGIYSDINGEGSVTAARLAAEEFGNELAGARIEIVSGDHQNKADIAANLARSWIDTDKVDVIADVPNSAAALAVQGITRDNKRIFLMSGPGSTELTGKQCSPYGFHWTWDNHALAAGTARALVEQGKKSWYFVTADYAFGHSLETEAATVVKQLGGTVVGDRPASSCRLLMQAGSCRHSRSVAVPDGDCKEARSVSLKQEVEWEDLSWSYEPFSRGKRTFTEPDAVLNSFRAVVPGTAL